MTTGFAAGRLSPTRATAVTHGLDSVWIPIRKAPLCARASKQASAKMQRGDRPGSRSQLSDYRPARPPIRPPGARIPGGLVPSHSHTVKRSPGCLALPGEMGLLRA